MLFMYIYIYVFSFQGMIYKDGKLSKSCPTINNAIIIDWDTLEGVSPKLETHPVNSFVPPRDWWPQDVVWFAANLAFQKIGVIDGIEIQQKLVPIIVGY